MKTVDDTHEKMLRTPMVFCDNGKRLIAATWSEYLYGAPSLHSYDRHKLEMNEFDVWHCPVSHCRVKENGGKVWPNHRSDTRARQWLLTRDAQFCDGFWWYKSTIGKIRIPWFHVEHSAI